MASCRLARDVAILVDRPAIEVFHHQIGSAVVGGATVEQTGDRRVVEAGQDLPLAVGTAHQSGGARPGLQQLDGDLADAALVSLPDGVLG